MPDAIDDLFRRFGKAFNKADVDADRRLRDRRFRMAPRTPAARRPAAC